MQFCSAVYKRLNFCCFHVRVRSPSSYSGLVYLLSSVKNCGELMTEWYQLLKFCVMANFSVFDFRPHLLCGIAC